MAGELTWAEQISGNRPDWLLILLHGLGSDEQDLLALSSELKCPLHTVSLRAPYRYVYGGFAWFDVDWASDGMRYDQEEAAASVELLAAEVKRHQERTVIPASRTILGGFSQGAMMSAGFGLAHPDSVAGLVLLSGALLAETIPADIDARFGKMPVMIQHGGSDPVLPLEFGHDLRDRMSEWSEHVVYKEYPRMGHQISVPSLQDLEHWICGLSTSNSK